MIQEIVLKNYRNFKSKKFNFKSGLNLIYGLNGTGKSSILEAINLFSNINPQNSKFADLVKDSEKSFYLNLKIRSSELEIAYDLENKKKVLKSNSKKLSKKKFLDESFKSVLFTPMSMNMFILGPNYRRDFLDTCLKSSYPSYEPIYKNYEKILKNRNACLKSISKGESSETSLNFWDKCFIEEATNIYRYRYILNKFLEEQVSDLGNFLIGKKLQTNYKYISKIKFDSPEKQIAKILKENLRLDIISGKTHVGPHIDDFDITINSKKIAKYASRGEAKSIIVGLKILESKFIEEKSTKKVIFLIDDFSSELDNDHVKIILESLNDRQIIVTNIEEKEIENCNIIKL